MENLIYAIYKENVLPMIGGVHPSDIEIGLAEYKGWHLCAMDISKISAFSEFKMYPISKSIAVGLMLQSQYQPIVLPPEDVLGISSQALTEDQEKLIAISLEFIERLDKKFLVRSKIREYKDFEDDLTDTKFILQLVTALMFEDYNAKSEDLKKLNHMGEYINNLAGDFSYFIDKFKAGTFDSKIKKAISDELNIKKIVDFYYLNTKK